MTSSGVINQRTITDPQIEFIKILLAERVIEDAHRAKIEKNLRTMTLGQAKELITWMKTLPKKPQSAPVIGVITPPPAPIGVANVPTLTEGVYAIVRPDGSEHLYAVRRRRKTRYVTDPGLYVVALTENNGRVWAMNPTSLLQANPRKLTIEETMQISSASGHCQVCGKKLHVAESVAAGIGPVCLNRQQRRMLGVV